MPGKGKAAPDEGDRGPGGTRSEACRRVEALALTLGNVSEACRQCGLPRRTFYAWKNRNRPSASDAGQAAGIRSPHPQAVSGHLSEEVIAISLANPEWGCDRISYFLKLKGRKVSSPTVQKILIRNGLGRESQRRARNGIHRPTEIR